MLFTNQFVYVKFKVNNFGILKISVANNLNTMNNYITDSGAVPERNWEKNLFLYSVIEGTIIISSIMKPFLLMVPIKCPFMALIFIASSYFI